MNQSSPYRLPEEQPAAAVAVPSRYVLHEVVGQGAFGQVYRATDALDGGEVALKVIAPGAGFDGKALAQEYRIAAEVSHPHILPVVGFGLVEGGGAWLAMKFLRASGFCEAASGLPVGEVLRWAGQILMGLDALHRRGLTHGDVKPNNLMVEREGERKAYLVDFGLTALAGEPGGAVAGTPATLAPEVASGGSREARSDLYSLGVVLYEALAGHNPFEAASVQETLRRHQQLVPAPLDTVRDDIPAAVARFVARLVAKDPARRWASAGQALAELEGILGPGSAISVAWLEQRISDPPVVGQEETEEALRDLLLGLAQGRGGARWLSGTRGCGRSVLLGNARQAALVAGLRVGRGQARSGAAPYDALVHAVADAVDCPRAAVPVVGSDAPTRAVEAIKTLLADRPALLILDDLDDADADTWAALASLVQLTAELPLGLAFASSARSGRERSLEARLHLVWAAAERQGIASRHSVGPIGREQAKHLFAELLGGPVDESTLAQPLWELGQGCPALMLELLRRGLRLGAVGLTGSGWRGGGDLRAVALNAASVDQTIAALERERLQSVGSEPRRVLLVLSLVDSACSMAELAVLAELGQAQVGKALGALLEGGYVEVQRGDAARYRVRDGWLTELVQGSAGATELAAAHAAVGRWLGRQLAPDDQPLRCRLAFHAAGAGQFSLALRLAEALAAEPSPRWTPDELMVVVRLLLANEAMAAASGDSGDGWQLRLLHALGVRLAVAGRWADALMAIEEARCFIWGSDAEEFRLDMIALEALAQLGRRADAEAALGGAEARAQRLAQRGQAAGHERAALCLRRAALKRLFSDPDSARLAAEEGLSWLESVSASAMESLAHRSLRARLLVERATADHHQGQFETSQAAAELALGIAKQVGFEQCDFADVAAKAANAVGNALRAQGDPVGALEYYALVRELASAQGWVATAGKAANNMAICHYLAGGWEAAALEWRRAVRLAEQSGEREEKIILLNNLGYLNFERGHVEAAESSWAEGLDLAQAAGHERMLMHLLGNLGELEWRTGRGGVAQERYSAALELALRLGAKAEQVELGRRMAELQLSEARWTEARALAKDALDLATSLGVRGDASRLSCVLALCAAQGSKVVAPSDSPADHLAAAEAWVEPMPSHAIERTIVELSAALVAEIEGRHTEAQQGVARAQEQFASLGALWFERDCEQHLARLKRKALVSRQAAGDVAGDELAALTTALQQTDEPETLADSLLNYLLGLSGASRGTLSVQTVGELDGFSAVVTRAHGAGAYQQSGESYSRTIALSVLESGREVLVEDVAGQDCLSATESVMAMDLHSVLCLPLIMLGSARGILYLDSRSLIGHRLSAALPTIRVLLAVFCTSLERKLWRRRFEAQMELSRQVAHELRSPIGSILGFAQLADQSRPTVGYGEDGDALVDIALSEAERMNSLVRRMYDLWLTDKTTVPTVTVCEPHQIAARVVRALRPQAEAAGISLLNAVLHNLPAILVDADSIQQVFTNLVGNALRHTPAGGTISLRGASGAQCEKLGDRPFVTLEVQDQGCGLNAEDQVRIFRKFDRGSNPSGSGSGLGLSICQSIVTKHGGKLWVESELGAGARFRFTVPAASPVV